MVGSDVNAAIDSNQFNDIYGFSIDDTKYIRVSSWRVVDTGPSTTFRFRRTQPSSYFTWYAIGN